MYYYPFFSSRAATILYGILRITLSVSEGTGFRQNRPLADAQGHSPPRKATNRIPFAACRYVLLSIFFIARRDDFIWRTPDNPERQRGDGVQAKPSPR